MQKGGYIYSYIISIREKINGKGSGIFPLDGYLGSGKSHIFRHPEKAKEWFEKWNIDFPEIENTVVCSIACLNPITGICSVSCSCCIIIVVLYTIIIILYCNYNRLRCICVK